MTKQLTLALPHDDAMGAHDFLITPCNKAAAAWVDQWPKGPAPGLVITGLPGSGKTHLLNVWLAKSKGRLITLQELITEDLPTLTFSTKNIALDKANLVVGNASAEEKLFHLYNYLQAAHGSLVLTLTQGVGQAGFVLPDLRSRLLTLPAAALLPPDDALLSALIIKQFRDRQVALDEDVVAYLVPRVARDAASIRDLVEKLDRAGLAARRKISIPLVREVLGEQHG